MDLYSQCSCGRPYILTANQHAISVVYWLQSRAQIIITWVLCARRILIYYCSISCPVASALIIQHFTQLGCVLWYYRSFTRWTLAPRHDVGHWDHCHKIVLSVTQINLLYTCERLDRFKVQTHWQDAKVEGFNDVELHTWRDTSGDDVAHLRHTDQTWSQRRLLQNQPSNTNVE